MPNYRYNSPDYMRRRNVNQNTVRSACQEPSCPVCKDSRGADDELAGMPVAMAYVPWQRWCNLFDAEKGFRRGTIFQELDKPFRGIGGCQNVR